MAIKRDKKEKSGRNIPETLHNLLKSAFTCTILEKLYKEDSSGFRSKIKNYLEHNEDGFEIELSKSWDCDFGKVNMQKGRESFDVDKDALIDLVESGKVSIASLIINTTFGAGLKKCLTEKDFASVATVKTGSEVLVLKPSVDFKDEVTTGIVGENVSEELENIEPVKPKKKAAAKKPSSKSSLEKLKAAKKKVAAKKPKKSADNDLDSILGDD